MSVRATEKLLLEEDLARLRAELGAARVAAVYGVFDVIDPAILVALEEARAEADVLVVAVAADAIAEREPGAAGFPEDLRVRAVAALELVDHVLLHRAPSLDTVITTLGPHVLRPALPTDPWGPAAEAEHGVSPAAREYARSLRAAWEPAMLEDTLDALKDLSVLVVGEAIIDEYVTCEAQGVTVKERVPSVRELEPTRHWGGAVAVARHLSELCGRVTLAGIAGPRDAVLDESEGPPGVDRAFVTDPAAQTIVKRRYVVENRLRGELTKVFVAHRMTPAQDIATQTREAFRRLLEERMPGYDLVVVTDYGHGLLDQAVIDSVQEKAPYLALNCQTNSSNYGFNLMTKYRRADTFCIDQIELGLIYQQPRVAAEHGLVERLRARLGASAGWLTAGAEGAVGVSGPEDCHHTPALTLHVRDTLGAGDAFFAVASAAARAGLPLDLSSFLASSGAAIAANITGNAAPVTRPQLLAFAQTVLRS